MLPLIQTGGGSSGGGGVTSFTGDVVVYNNSGSTGAVTLSLIAQIANKVFAGPSSGGNAAPTFRSLVGADLPNPSASTLGGIQSLAAVGSRWINAISTAGIPSASQPAFTDISGQASLTTQVSGVLPPANGGVANFATAGQGYFWGVAGLNDSAVAGTATIISPTGANNVLVFQFIVPYTITVRKIVFMNGAVVTAAATASFGIYSLAGNLLIDSGAFSTAVASQTLSNTLGSPVTLAPGIYWFAQASTNTTNTSAGNITWNTGPLTSSRQVNTTRQGVAANAYNGTALPATLGVVTGNVNRAPVAVLFES